MGIIYLGGDIMSNSKNNITYKANGGSIIKVLQKT